MSEQTQKQSTFEPARYLTKIGSADYLEVKHRVLWFRTDNPLGSIETDVVELSDKRAVFRARIVTEDGGSATGFGSEVPADFKDFVEKAETKAIGRALAALGYGTQFSYDFEDGAQQGRPVDAPVNRPGNASAASNSGALATEKQRDFIISLLQKNGFPGNQASAWVEATYPHGIPRSEATPTINRIKAGEIQNVAENGASAPSPDPVGELVDGRPKSAVTLFWERAKELGLNNMEDVKGYLPEVDLGKAKDFTILLRSLNEKAASIETGTPF